MTRPTSVALSLSAAAAALSLTIVNSTSVAAAAPRPETVAPAAGTAMAGVASLRFGAIPLNWATPARWFHRYPQTHLAHQKRGKTYTVQRGDSFSSIAENHHANWFNLAADNKMQMYTILDAGQVLRLPAPGEKTHAPMPLQASAPAGAMAASSAAGPVAQGPAAAAPAPVAPSGAMSSFEQCVISRESGGNPQVMNGSGHWGLFQFSEATWVGYGGSPGDFGNASAAVQEQVFANAMARGGESNWAPYDGC